MFKYLTLVVASCLMVSCSSAPPKQQNNICQIFEEKSGWYKDALRAERKWGVPISVNMAFMYQESRFVANAKPPRKKILGFIPGPRKSSSYGYSQAKKETWKWYKKQSGHSGADRNDFDDAIDFVAWYNKVTVKKLGVAPNDAYALYLAYHEGHGGFKRGTHKKKQWLLNVASKVSQRAKRYDSQLKKCEKRLNTSWWLF
ncbi:MAG: transglycosylase SLT domain-containing protein [Agarilytica sp.]